MSKRVIAIGVFDGVHIGHQDLIRRAKEMAESRAMSLTALTFHPHPMSVVKNSRVELLATLEQRKRWLSNLGVDDVQICEFTKERSEQSADDFVTSFLQSTLHADIVVIGEGFRFGHKASGTAETIRAHGLEVIEVAHTMFEEERVSSTRIRASLLRGDLQQVSAMLGRNFEVEGHVVEGFQRGRDLGFPTANLAYENALVLPIDGVYAGYFNFDNKKLPAAISIGYNSTFQADARTLEVHALTKDWLDVYGKKVSVEFVEFIRTMQSFDGIETLIQAIENDILSVKKALNLG